MKTLIFNGSPRKNGDTVFLINELIEYLRGEVNVINTYLSPIKPCLDCRYCWKNCGCSIKDEMQVIYDYIKDCDNIIIASPLYFSELTGSLLAVGSRLQMFYASKRFVKINQIQKKKNGAIILCGGGDGGPEKAEETAKTLLKLMNSQVIKTIYSLKTDDIPSKDDNSAKQQILDLAISLNKIADYN